MQKPKEVTLKTTYKNKKTIFLFSMAALEEEDNDDDEGEECEGRKKVQVTSHQASHTNYLMMQGFCSPGIGKTFLLDVISSHLFKIFAQYILL